MRLAVRRSMKLPTVLILGVASAVLAGAGLVFPNAAVASTAFATVCAVVALSAIAAIVRRDQLGAASCGFAVFAAAYFLFTVLAEDLYTAVNSQLGTSAEPPESPLITTYFLAWAYDRLGHPEMWTAGGSRVPSLFLLRFSPSFDQISASIDVTHFRQFMNIGQCLFTLSMGLIGGWIGWRLGVGKTPEKSIESQVAR